MNIYYVRSHGLITLHEFSDLILFVIDHKNLLYWLFVMQIPDPVLGDFKSVGLGWGARLHFWIVLRNGVPWTLQFLTHMLDHSNWSVARTALWEKKWCICTIIDKLLGWKQGLGSSSSYVLPVRWVGWYW